MITLLSLRLEALLDPIRCRVLDVVEAVKKTQFEIGRHDEGYSMCGSKKIRSQIRIFNPWGTGQKGGYSEEQRNAQKRTTKQAEKSSEEAVDKAQTDG